jgi:hypothetical protein
MKCFHSLEAPVEAKTQDPASQSAESGSSSSKVSLSIIERSKGASNLRILWGVDHLMGPTGKTGARRSALLQDAWVIFFSCGGRCRLAHAE